MASILLFHRFHQFFCHFANFVSMLFGNLALVKMGIIPTRLSRVKVGISLPLSSHNLAINLLFSAMTLSCLGCKEAQIFSLFSAKFWPAAYFISYGTITEPKSFLYFGTTRI